ncbi:MAG: zinc-dependent metalloprotease, partial [Acidimicrobiales bacterium]
MSTPSTPGGNPFENMLGDLLRILSQAGPVQWDLARQMAASVASDTQPEPNVDPLERIRLEELARVAELHVVEATGLRATREAASIGIHPLTRTDWALRTLDSWRPLLESLSRSLSADPPATLDDPDAESDRLAGLLGSLGRAVGPAMLGLQFGSSVGHLARRALGQYDFPVPRAGGEELAVVPANLTGFAEDWSLPGDDVRLWVCVSEVAHHAVFGRPHVRARLEELLSGYVSGFRPDTTGLEERLAGVDLNDLGSLQAALGDPSGLVRERESPEQASTRARLEALVAAVEGYVDHVTDVVGHRLIVSFGPLTEALRRRRVERDSGERFMEQLFGLELSQACFDRGSAFVHG